MSDRSPIPRLRPSLVEWLCLAAGLFASVHYAWLMDDAFVYFRYVDNLLYLKLGLVYNHGEYVEGYSSPLWVLLLTALRAATLNYWLMVRLLAVVCFAATWACLVAVNRRLAPPRATALNLPLVYLTFHYGVQTSFSSGLETPLVQVAGAAFALLLVHPASGIAQAAVGLAPLARPELLLPFGLAVVWCRHREGVWPRWALGVAAVTLAGWMLFRITYYADLLPNTFYLKNAAWVGQGFRYLADTLNTYGLHVVLVVFAALAYLLRRRGVDVRATTRGVMLACALSVTAYVVKIGGDFLHYRYLAFPFVLAAASCGGLVEAAFASLRLDRRRAVGWALAVAAAGGTWFLYPRTLDRHPFSLRAKPDGETVVEDAMAHRLRPELARDPWESGAAYDQRAAYAEYRATHPRYTFARLVADYWCVRNYERFDWYTVQSLGLTDPVLARIDVPSQRPGHRWHLHPLGQQIVQMRATHGFGRGVYQRAIAAGDAPDWVEANAPALDVIDRRAYNRHSFFENLGLALKRPGRIELVSPPPPVPTRQGRKLGS